MRIFSRDGFERSRLADIAAEAGYTRGALYANFESKEDLFIALLEAESSRRIAEIAHAVQTAGGPENYQTAFRDYYIGQAGNRQWTLLMLEFKLYVLRNKQHRARFAAASRRIREALPNLLKNMLPDHPRQLFPEKTAKLLLGVILNGIVLEHACDPKLLSSQEVSYLLGQTFDLVTSNAPKLQRRRLPAAG